MWEATIQDPQRRRTFLRPPDGLSTKTLHAVDFHKRTDPGLGLKGLLVGDNVQEEQNPYLAFCGILPKEGTDELCKSLESQRTIDPEFWK